MAVETKGRQLGVIGVGRDNQHPPLRIVGITHGMQPDLGTQAAVAAIETQ